MTFFVVAMIIWFTLDILLSALVLFDTRRAQQELFSIRFAYITIELSLLMWALTLLRSM